MKKLSVLLLLVGYSLASFAQLDNQFYLRFGLSKPTSSYAGLDQLEDDYSIDIKRTGAVFELGSIFMLNSIPLGDNMAIGINVDYADFDYHSFKFDDDYHEIVFGISSKVGPSFSYSPVSDLTFDAALKLKINWFSTDIDVTEDSDNDVYVGTMGLGFATGINVRYKFLMLALEFNKVNVKLVNADDETDYYGNYSDDGDKTPMPAWNIMLGFSF
jgi:hypothetical protein